MGVEMGGIKQRFQTTYRLGVQQGGKLYGHTVKLFKHGLEKVRKDVYTAGATVAIANVIFCQIAFRIANAGVSKIRNRFQFQNHKSLTFFNLSLSSVLVAGMNLGLHYGLKSQLTRFTKVGAAVAVFAAHLFYFYKDYFIQPLPLNLAP